MKTKKLIAMVLTAAALSNSAHALAEENSIHVIAGKGRPVKVTIADEKHYDATIDGYNSIVFDEETLPFVDENGRTQLPLRKIAEELDFKVDWEEAEKKITLTKEENVIVFRIGSEGYTVNGAESLMDTAPVIVNDFTFVPLRYLCEAVGYTVEYTDRNLVEEVETYTTGIEDMWDWSKVQ